MNENNDIKKSEREWQDVYGGELQEKSYGRPGTRVVLDRQFAQIAKSLNIGPGMKILDIGCGMGHLLSWFSKLYSAEYFGIDLSLNTIKSARGNNPSFKLIVADAENISVKGQSFDRVVINGVGHHFLNPSAAFREIYRIMAPSGILVMYEPVSTFIPQVMRKLFVQNDKLESPADLSQKEDFTRESLQKALAEAGFTDISSGFHDFLAYPLSGMYMDFPLGRSERAMKFLCWAENNLERLPFLKPVFDCFSYRLLVRAVKPGRTV